MGGGQCRSCVRLWYLAWLGQVTELMRIRGHFKQSETPEAREELRLKMEAKEEARAKAAKKALEEFEENRKK